MNSAVRRNPEQVLRAARGGDGDALGLLLEAYRSYLRLLAQLQIDRRLQGKANASDLVQETSLQAHRLFRQFKGTSEGEFLQWLRRILSSRISKLLRRYFGTKARDVRLERTLNEELDRSSQVARAFLMSETSPSEQAVRREQAVLMADALDRLPADYREVIILRHLKELTFPDLARQMGRSEGSAKQLWVRALGNLRQLVGGEMDGSQ